MSNPRFATIGIVGVGAMGRGIAQLAAQAGSRVRLHDTRPEAIEAAQQSLLQLWEKLAAKGKFTQEQIQAFDQRLIPTPTLEDLADCELVVEAIIERLDIKQELHARLEGIVSPQAVLATNTSSLSVTGIASGLKTPSRFAGYHFFNPAPLMKVAEVVAGLKTDPATCDALAEYTQQMGHTPVRCGDTPGFVVNHLGRGYGTESLQIAGDAIADFVTVDRVLRDQVGFRMGPFELFDLTALDVSHPAMEAIYHQYYEEPRFRPSVITAQRLAGRVLGRKTSEGFYPYVDGKQQVPPELPAPQVEKLPPVWVEPGAMRRSELLQLLATLGARVETGARPSADALIVLAPLGTDVTRASIAAGVDPARSVGMDLLAADADTRRRVLASCPATRSDMRNAAHALFARDGKPVSLIEDSPGFITQRVVATIVNIAANMCQQRVCSPQDLDTAVTLGLGYPMGPLAMGNHYGLGNIQAVLDNMHRLTGDPRYRANDWLRRRAALGLDLMAPNTAG